MKADSKTIRRLKSIGACAEAIKWVRTQSTFKAAWFNCSEDGWLEWLLTALGRRGLISDTLCERGHLLYMWGTTTPNLADAEVKWNTEDIMRDGLCYDTIRKAMARIKI